MKWKSWHADGVTAKQIPNVLSACCFTGFEEIIALEVYVLEETRHFYVSISWLCFLLINALVYPTDYSSYSLFISLTVGHSTIIFL